MGHATSLSRHLICLLGLAAALTLAANSGCAADGGDDGDGPTPVDPIPQQSGSFIGSYRVPVPDDLAAAATFAVDHVDWTVAGGVATLHYDLPIGLVGGALDVRFTGPIAAGADQITLTSADGTGVCVARGLIITCHETFTGLGALPLSMRVVEQTAAVEYAGPVADRSRVASLFDADPIGIVELDLARPAIDDHGGDDSP